MATGGVKDKEDKELAKLQEAQEQWRSLILVLYPDTLTRTYSVPPLHFNRVPFDFVKVGEQVVLVALPSGHHRETTVTDGSTLFPVALSPAQTTASPASAGSGNAKTGTQRTKANREQPKPGTKKSKAGLDHSNTATEKPADGRENVAEGKGNAGECGPSSGNSSVERVSIASTEEPASGKKKGKNKASVGNEDSRESASSDVQASVSAGESVDKADAKDSKKNQQSHKAEATALKKEQSTVSTYCNAKNATDSTRPCDSKDEAPSSSPAYSPWQPEKIPRRGTKPPKVQDFHIQSDFAQQHVLANLKKLGEHRQETMFIVSELDFKDYLNKPTFNKVTAKLPRPVNMNAKQREKGLHKGDFDILIVTLRHGILVGELKSVGKSEMVDDDLVKRRVHEALGQVEKEATVVRHLISDIADDAVICKTLLLPYISREQLGRVLSANPELAEEACTILGVGAPDTDSSEAAGMCVCADHLSDPDTYWDITIQSLGRLTTWWLHRMGDASLTNEQYLKIVSRFVGPATTVRVHCTVTPRVEVRTHGDAIAELGRRLSCMVLTQQQVSILNRNQPRVCITGPPGTGKTLMLVLQGLRWLREGLDVVVVSTESQYRVSAYSIHHQLKTTIEDDSSASGRLHYYQASFSVSSHVEKDELDIVAEAAEKVGSYARGGKLCVLLDEGGFDYSMAESHRKLRLVSLLTHKLPDFRVWATCQFTSGCPTDLVMSNEVVTTPLRSAPSVLREVMLAVDIFRDSHMYDTAGVTTPTDGLEVIKLHHEGEGHECEWPFYCFACGKNVAKKLHHLEVGSKDDSKLRYSDVLVLTGAYQAMDFRSHIPPYKDKVESSFKPVFTTDGDGNITSSNIGFIQGLLEEKIPVCFLNIFANFIQSTDTEKRSKVNMGNYGKTLYSLQEECKKSFEENMVDMVEKRTNRVTISDYINVYGTERPIVVYLPGRSKFELFKEEYLKGLLQRYRMGRNFEDKNDRCTELQLDAFHGLSRCSTQLIYVEVPSDEADEKWAALKFESKVVQKMRLFIKKDPSGEVAVDTNLWSHASIISLVVAQWLFSADMSKGLRQMTKQNMSTQALLKDLLKEENIIAWTAKRILDDSQVKECARKGPAETAAGQVPMEANIIGTRFALEVLHKLLVIKIGPGPVQQAQNLWMMGRVLELSGEGERGGGESPPSAAKVSKDSKQASRETRKTEATGDDSNVSSSKGVSKQKQPGDHKKVKTTVKGAESAEGKRADIPTKKGSDEPSDQREVNNEDSEAVREEKKAKESSGVSWVTKKGFLL